MKSENGFAYFCKSGDELFRLKHLEVSDLCCKILVEQGLQCFGELSELNGMKLLVEPTALPVKLASEDTVDTPYLELYVFTRGNYFQVSMLGPSYQDMNPHMREREDVGFMDVLSICADAIKLHVVASMQPVKQLTA